MALLNLTEVLAHAGARQGVAAIDVIDYESADAVFQTAAHLGVPVIVMVPEKAFPYIDVPLFFAFLVQRARLSPVPVCLHLDHGESLEGVMIAIRHGCSSVMIDGSSLPFAENVGLTCSVVDIAHRAGISVEAELGKVSGDEGNFESDGGAGNIYTSPAEATRFAAETGVDALAISFGTVHGVYRGAPRLDYDLVRTIAASIPTPLVMHGASGLPDDEYQRAVQAGIRKINLFTEISLAGVRAAHAAYESKAGKLHFAELVGMGKLAIAEQAAHYMRLISNL